MVMDQITDNKIERINPSFDCRIIQNLFKIKNYLIKFSLFFN